MVDGLFPESLWNHVMMALQGKSVPFRLHQTKVEKNDLGHNPLTPDP